MKFILLTLLSMNFFNCFAEESCKHIVTEYLKDYGYLNGTSTFEKIELKRSIRQFQKENELPVNGKITSEVCTFIKHAIDRQMVIEFLKMFRYFVSDVNPTSLKEAVKKLQYNSGSLNVNGEIDQETIDFVSLNRHGHSEPPLI